MNTAKRTYALPRETLAQFESIVSPGSRSSVIADLIGRWLEDRERAFLRAEIEVGLREMADDYLEAARDWAPLDAEVDRALDR